MLGGAVALLNGIVAAGSVAAVLVLLFAAPLGAEAGVALRPRKLGIIYAASLTVLCTFLFAPEWPAGIETALRPALTSTVLLLFNVPALVYVTRSLHAEIAPASSAAVATDGVVRLADAAGLSDREREVLALLVAGLATKSIGDKLFISPKTVKNHITSIYAKTGAKNRVLLANLTRGETTVQPRE